MNGWMTLASTVAVALALLTVAGCSQRPDEATQTPVVVIKLGGIEGTVVDPLGAPAAGMRVGIINGTVAFPEIGPETDDEGYYLISSVSPGTFQVAVHDRDGQRVGLGSVDVNSGVIATLDFAISAETTPTSATVPVGSATET